MSLLSYKDTEKNAGKVWTLKVLLCCLLAVVLVGLAIPLGYAADGTWTGGGAAGVWADDTNWDGATYPGTNPGETGTIATDGVTITTFAPANAPHLVVNEAAANNVTVTFNTGASVTLQNIQVTNLAANNYAISLIFNNGVAAGDITITGDDDTTEDATLIVKGNSSANSLTIDADTNGSAKFDATTTDSAVDIDGDVTLNDAAGIATLQPGDGQNFNVGGSFTVGATNAVFASGTSTVVFDGATGKLLTSGGDSFYNLTLNKAAAGNTLTLQDVLTITNNLTITQGTLVTGSNILTVPGTTDIDGTLDISGSATHVLATVDLTGGTLASTSGTTTIQVSTDWTTGSGTLPLAANNWTLEFTGAVTYTLGAPVAGTFSTLKKSGVGVATLGSAMTLDDALDIDAGEVAAGANAFTVGTTTDIAAGTQLWSTTGKITLGSGAVTNAGTITTATGEIESGSSVVTNSGTISTTGAGTLDFDIDVASTGTITIFAGSTVTFAADLNLTGDVAFTHNNVTITFDGTSELTTDGQTFPDVTVSSTLTLLDDLTLESGENLTINGTVTTGSYILTVPGITDVNGTLDISGTATHVLNTVDLDGTLSQTNAGNTPVIQVSTAWDATNATLPGNPWILELTTGIAFVPGAGTYQNLLKSGTGTATVTTNSLNLNGWLSITGGNVAAAGNALTVGTTTDIAASTQLSSTSGKITLGSGTVTNAGTITTATGEIESGSGVVTNSGTISTTSTGTLDFNSNVTVAAGATLEVAGGGIVELSAHLDNSAAGTLSLATTSTLKMDGANAKVTTVTLTVGVLDLDDAVITGTVTGNLIVAGTGSDVADGKTLNVTGNTTLNESLTATAGGIVILGGTLTVDATKSLTINTGELEVTGATTLNGTIQCANAGGTLDFDAAVTIGATGNLDVTVAASVEFAGNLTNMAGGTLTLVNVNVDVNGDSTFDVLDETIGTLDVINVTMTFNSSTANQTLTVTGATSVDSSLVIAGDDNMVFNGDFTLGSGDTVTVQDTATATFGDAAADTITFNGNVSCSSTATTALTFNGTTTIPGSLTVTGTGSVTASAGMTNANGTIQIDSTLTFNSGVSGTANFGGGTSTLNNLTIDPGAGDTIKLSGNASIETIVNGVLTLTSGTLNGGDAPGPTLTLTKGGTGAASPIQVTAGVFNGNGGTVKYTGATETDITPFTGVGTSYNNLTIDSTGPATTRFNLSATTSLTGNLLVINGVLYLGAGDTLDVTGTSTFEKNGTLDINGNGTFTGLVTYNNDLTNNGNLVIDGGLSVNGNFVNNAPLTLDSTVTISGTFYNNSTLNLTGGSLQANEVINASADTLVVDGTVLPPPGTYTITTNKFINDERARIHINGGGILTFAPLGTDVKLNNAGIINIGASASPGSAGNGQLRPNAATDTVHLLNTGVINIGSDTAVGSLGTTAEPLASLNNVGLAPVTGTGSIIATDATTGDNVIAVRGDWESAGTFIAGDTTLTLSSTGVLEHTSINGFNSLTISSGTRTLESKLVVGSDFTLNAGAKLMVGSNNVNINGTTTISGRMTASGGTQTYNQDLTISANATYDNGANNVTVNFNGSFTNNGIAILGNGTIKTQAITNSGQLTAASGNLSVTGAFTNSGTFNHNNGTITFTDGGAFTTGGPTVIYNHITKTGLGTTTTLGAALTMIGDLVIEYGELDADTFDITVAGNVSSGGNSLDIDGADLILNPSAGTTKTFDPGTTASVYGDIIKRGAGVTQLINNPLILSVAGSDLLIEAGTFAMGDQNVTVVDDLTISDTATLTDSTGTLTVGGNTTINGALATSGSATHRFVTLTVSIDGIYDNDTNAVTVNATGAVTNNGTVTLGSGEVDFIAGLTNSNIFTATAGNLSIVGNVTNTGAFDHNGGTVIFGGNVTFNPGLSIYNNITKSGAGTIATLGADFTSVGTLNVAAGTMALGSHTVSLGDVDIGVNGTLTQDANGLLKASGNFTNNGVYEPNVASTLSLTGTGTFTPGASDYSGTLLTSGVVTLAEGSTLNFAGETWTNTGAFDTGTNTTIRFNRSGGDQTLTTGGAPNVPAMTFVNIETDNDDTITFATAINLNGILTIAGGATVRDVTPGSVYNFADTARVVVSGILILTGSPADHIQLLGPGGGEGSPRWTFMLNSSGTVYLNNVDLRDSELITHGGSLNGKNVGYTVVSLGNLSPSWGPYDPAPAPYIGTTIAPDQAQPGTAGLLVTLIGGNFSADTTVSFGDGITVVGLDASGAPMTLVVTINVAANARPGARHIKLTNPDGEYTTKLNAFTVSNDTPVIPMTIAGDANGDEVVNLVDFSILAAVFGTADARADFNGDNLVTLADFSILAANFGKTATQVVAAPIMLVDGGCLSLHVPSKLHRGEVVEVAVMAKKTSLKAYSFVLDYDSSRLKLLEDGIAEGDFLKDTLFIAQNGRVFSATRSNASEGTGVLTRLSFQVFADGVSGNAIALREVQIVDRAGRFSHLPELHASLNTVPDKTRLLANYPNPFNPETWIPFELARDTVVTIRIFNARGRIIRHLNLGYRNAGSYTDKSVAAYWDGKNESKERVSSGIYFYQLSVNEVNRPFQSGEPFSQIRRMLIIK